MKNINKKEFKVKKEDRKRNRLSWREADFQKRRDFLKRLKKKNKSKKIKEVFFCFK